MAIFYKNILYIDITANMQGVNFFANANKISEFGKFVKFDKYS